jgi:hypothetical protein
MMIFNSKPSSHVQVGWAACPKCQSMHFGAGRFPAGGGHVQTNSFATFQPRPHRPHSTGLGSLS